MSRALRLTSFVALLVYAVAGVHYLRGPALASDSSCYPWARGAYCGAEVECVKVVTLPGSGGGSFCEEYRFYDTYYLQYAGDGCICERGRCQCPGETL